MFSQNRPFYNRKLITLQEPLTPIDLIKQEGWTYEQAAQYFEVEPSTIYRWLSGKVKKISKKNIIKAENYRKKVVDK